MRHINALSKDKVPRDDEFHFKDRAKALVDRWHEVLNDNKGNSKANGTAESAKATTNGTSPDAKAADAADAGAMTNGLEEGEKSKGEAADSAMEVEPKAPKVDAEESVPAAAKNESGDADGDAEMNEDAPADLAGDESVLADVTMSEAA